MRAIVIQGYGGVEHLVIKELPEPEPKLGHAVIEVKAFGDKPRRDAHAKRGVGRGGGGQRYRMRRSGEILPGRGIRGRKQGRGIDGRPGANHQWELCRVYTGSRDQRGLDRVRLPWEELAALPESYATAWTCLFRDLELVKGQTLVIRGGMSSFGQAALNMSVNAGAEVIATTRKGDPLEQLESLGARRVEFEGPDLSSRISERKQIDAVLDLVGNSTILDSLACFGEVGVHAWRASLAALLRCPTLTLCSRCRAVSTLASSAVLCSAPPVFRSRMSSSSHRQRRCCWPLQGKTGSRVSLRRNSRSAQGDGS